MQFNPSAPIGFVPLAEAERRKAVNVWAAPEPLVGQIHREAYPVEALPPIIRDAVRDVQACTAAPVELVASSALATSSVACQALADVRRGAKLVGPVSLYFLSIADSGERKSTAESHFTAAVKAFEANQRENAKPGMASHKAAMAAWETRRDDALGKMTAAAKGNKDLTGAENDLAKIEGQKPDAPRVPRLLFEDVTPERLGRALATEWPSAGIFSSEGGSILGSHAMSKDSLARTLSLFNKLWSAESHTVDRAQAASFAVRGARLSMHIAVQPHLWADYLANDRGMSRGGGFIARLLIAAPASTQGTRKYREISATPGLDAYASRIAELLAIVPPVDPERGLQPPVLEFPADAKAAWEQHYNAIEAQQRTTGDFAGVTDIASKAADNIARLAAILHIVMHGATGAIEPETVRDAGQIILWHLYAAKAVLGPLALSRDQANAVTLSRWLIDRCKAEGATRFATRTILQGGPPSTRQKAALDGALKTLAEHGHARLVEIGRRREIEINPALLVDSEPEPEPEPEPAQKAV